MPNPQNDRPPLPTDYLAWTWQKPGTPDALQLQRKTLRLPAAGEVLIANRVAALNPVDWKIVQAGHPAWQPGRVPGVDGVGTVAAVGDGVTLAVGARYAYHQGLAHDGSFAQYTVVRADCLLAVPDTLSDELAACLPCPGLTAWQALRKVPDTPDTPGRDVLVSGAGGAVGLILVQLALRHGWRVWATASPKHHDQLAALGAAGVFDYREAGWTARLQTALGARRLFAVFDTVSGTHARSLAPHVGYNGHLVCIQDRLEAAPLAPFTTAISLHEVALNSAHAHASPQDWQSWRADGERLMAQLRIGNLALPEIATHAFDALPAALAALRAGTNEGKQLIRI
ncbi:alcohol dehydrogenase [Burkholderia sp. WAC0059]|uniref:zinc-binding dehydrogenase n=1 Tax=Burkholderia sp. WAC0059 TaxID=2066022 RepID=UPI000C7F402E|nr:zinc-binding dehydrogenase [Burkholderia sp. WAC0059]PLZ00876.1 alcohol dehydrogenase [Burkholderia sp. WAC0059]